MDHEPAWADGVGSIGGRQEAGVRAFGRVPDGRRTRGRPRCVVATVESDAHAWNLVYLQLLLEERGFTVRNLGSCTPVELVVTTVAQERPDLLVVSSVNGHGHHGVRVLLGALAVRGLEVPCVVGGKLTVREEDDARVRQNLLDLGCAGVFVGPGAIAGFDAFLDAWLPGGVNRAHR